MKTFARVESGVVRELLTAAELPPFHPSLDWRDVTDVAGIAERWTVSGSSYLPPEPPPVIVPPSVTMRQARLALLNAGKLADVTAAINALPSPQKEAAQIEWEYSQEVRRDREFVQQLAPALGFTEQQLDELFIQAATL